MDDAVIERPAPAPIPILSPALHCVAMTGLVYLRRSFGYTFLRPKSIFFAFSWAAVLAIIIAWNEPAVWLEYRSVCLFAGGAVLLYWVHFTATFFSEWQKTAVEDHYPGKSHFESFVNVSVETLHFAVEPALVAVVGILLRFAFREFHLSTWLFFVAFCMLAREAINRWTTLRRDKAFAEGINKAQRQGGNLSPGTREPSAPKATRKEPVKRPRNTASVEEKALERRFAELLRIRPPYSLEKAEENYLTLIKLEHPDATDQSAESNARAAELNEAIEFFRRNLRV